MLLKIKGHSRIYDIQSMCMLFFPYEKPEITDTLYKKASLKILSEVYSKNSKIYCRTVIYINKKVYNGISKAKDSQTLSLRDALKKSFYKAGIKATDILPPWGVLTGIRPANTAMELLEKGYEDKETEKILIRDYFLLPSKASLSVNTAKKGLIIKKQSYERDASLYISIPFCPSRCYYCSFVSHSVEKALSLLPEYEKALSLEIKNTACEIKENGLRIKSVYMGGGTPTVLSSMLLENIMKALTESIDFHSISEFTVEAGRPDTLTGEKLEVLKNYSVSRLCVNTQTLNDNVLKQIGRRHTAKDFYNAFNLARKKGFSNINVDLIAGLTGDTKESFTNTLKEVISLRPENITVHTLCVKRAADLSSDKDLFLLKSRWAETEDMLNSAESLLKDAGYSPYYMYRQKNTLSNLENTGYSLIGKECLYNAYMMDDIHTIVGVGAGGVTKIINPSTREIKRVFNYKYPYEYLKDFNKTKNKLQYEGSKSIEGNV